MKAKAEEKSKCKYEGCSEEALKTSKERYCIFHERDDNKDQLLFLTKIRERIAQENYNFRGFYFVGLTEYLVHVFQKEVDFSNTLFSRTALFRGAQFLKDVTFKSTVFRQGAIFWFSKFGGDANFGEVKFLHKANFKSAQFYKQSIFRKADFQGETTFEHVQFSKSAVFDYAEFSSKSFFKNVDFFGVSSFYGTTFNELADFQHAHFHESAVFRQVNFLARVIFSSTRFERRAEFLGAKFNKHAFFMRAIFCGDANFESTKFFDTLDMKSVDLNAFRFAGSNIETLDLSTFKWPKGYKSIYEKSAKTPREYKTAEHVYRKLKISYHKTGNSDETSRFYYREMECKRKGVPLDKYNIIKKLYLFSWYSFLRLLFGYGEKPWSVLAFSASFILLFALLFMISGINNSTGLPLVNYDFSNCYLDLKVPVIKNNLMDYKICLYYSVITFTTLGYGDVRPTAGCTRLFSMLEALLGCFLMAIFVVTFARKVTR